ncbi:MAG: hypothetical protein JWM21_1069 [Acidobacteria bacterium]|nr:hypothetical protein [Acidobacteriota bacterium]
MLRGGGGGGTRAAREVITTAVAKAPNANTNPSRAVSTAWSFRRRAVCR